MENTGKAAVTDLGRASRANVYFEPELYFLLQKVALNEGKSFSTLVRGIVVQNLLSKNQIPADLMIRLLTGA